jgi:hypothetical protein
VDQDLGHIRHVETFSSPLIPQATPVVKRGSLSVAGNPNTGDMLIVSLGNFVGAVGSYVSDNLSDLGNFMSADMLATAGSLVPVSSSSFSGHWISGVRSAITVA